MSDEAGEASMREVRFHHSPSLVEALRQLRCSLLVSTYQAGKLLAVGADHDGLHFSFRSFDQAMGVAVRPSEVAVGAEGQVWFLRGAPDLARRLPPAGRYDRCYLPRRTAVTGSIHCHELAWGTGGELWVVNTLFSCLATLDDEHSFVPRWRPPFVSELAAEDRCHLNGLAMRDGKPAFVTVMAQTDTAGGWRLNRNDTGCVLDVASGEVVTTGLAMPHSPRWRDGRLYVLDSGRGALCSVDQATGEREVIAHVPGYARGLALHGNLAFIGLSRIREQHVFGGVPIAERHEELKCGVGVIDLDTGATVATLEFESGVEELFDVQVVPETRGVSLGASEDGRESEHEIWVVPQPR